jgi:hypothetical protein
MIGSVRFAVLMLGICIVCGARADPLKETPAARYRALVREYQAVVQDSTRAGSPAKAGEPSSKTSTGKPDPASFASRFLHLARENPGDRASFDALSWVLAHAPHGPEADQAYELLGANHLAEMHLVPVLQHLSRSRSPAAEALLRTALEKSPEPEVQAHACYSLALLLGSREHPPAPAKKRGVRPPKGQDKPGSQPVHEKIHEEVELLYGRLATEFHNVKFSRKKTFGDLARPALERLRVSEGRAGGGPAAPAGSTLSDRVGLEVGMIAPEVTGIDTRGLPMRLSAFRGRVVVLDFWGHW